MNWPGDRYIIFTNFKTGFQKSSSHLTRADMQNKQAKMLIRLMRDPSFHPMNFCTRVVP